MHARPRDGEQGGEAGAALPAEVVADAPFTTLGDDDLVALLEAAEQVGRLADAARVGLTSQVMTRTTVVPGESKLCVRYGCRTATDLVTRLTGISTREATRRARLGAALDGVHGTSGWQIRMVGGSPHIKAPPRFDKTGTWRPANQHRANQPSEGR